MTRIDSSGKESVVADAIIESQSQTSLKSKNIFLNRQLVVVFQYNSIEGMFLHVENSYRFESHTRSK